MNILWTASILKYCLWIEVWVIILDDNHGRDHFTNWSVTSLIWHSRFVDTQLSFNILALWFQFSLEKFHAPVDVHLHWTLISGCGKRSFVYHWVIQPWPFSERPPWVDCTRWLWLHQKHGCKKNQEFLKTSTNHAVMWIDVVVFHNYFSCL